MDKPKLITASAPPELHARLERARRLPVFEKIPTLSALVRLLLETGLDRLEAKAAEGAR